MQRPGRARGKPAIRQNPPTAGNKAGEHCPIHGPYAPPPEVGLLFRRAAAAVDHDPHEARELLAEAVICKRTCPDCDGICPTGVDRAAQVRREIERTPTCPMCGMKGDTCRC